MAIRAQQLSDRALTGHEESSVFRGDAIAIAPILRAALNDTRRIAPAEVIIDIIAEKGNVVDAASAIGVSVTKLRKWLSEYSKESPRVSANSMVISIDGARIPIFTDEQLDTEIRRGLSDTQIATKFEVANVSVRQRRRNLPTEASVRLPGDPLPEPESRSSTPLADKIRPLAKQGMTVPEIAKELNRDPKTIRSSAKKSKIKIERGSRWLRKAKDTQEGANGSPSAASVAHARKPSIFVKDGPVPKGDDKPPQIESEAGIQKGRMTPLPAVRHDDPKTNPMTPDELARLSGQTGAALQAALRYESSFQMPNGSRLMKRRATLQQVEKRLEPIKRIEERIVAAAMIDDVGTVVRLLSNLETAIDKVIGVIQPDAAIPVKELVLRDLADLFKEQRRIAERYGALLQSGVFERDEFHEPIDFRSIFHIMNTRREEEIEDAKRGDASWIGEYSPKRKVSREVI
jgi:DNA-binding NarL/FixJ family response regulator